MGGWGARGNKNLMKECTGWRWSDFWKVLLRILLKWTYQIYLIADGRQQVSYENGLKNSLLSIKMYIFIKYERYERLNKLNQVL